MPKNFKNYRELEEAIHRILVSHDRTYVNFISEICTGIRTVFDPTFDKFPILRSGQPSTKKAQFIDKIDFVGIYLPDCLAGSDTYKFQIEYSSPRPITTYILITVERVGKHKFKVMAEKTNKRLIVI
jgi:hypothetical protein